MTYKIYRKKGAWFLQRNDGNWWAFPTVTDCIKRFAEFTGTKYE